MSNSEAREYIDFALKQRKDNQPSNMFQVVSFLKSLSRTNNFRMDFKIVVRAMATSRTKTSHVPPILQVRKVFEVTQKIIVGDGLLMKACAF